MNSAFSVSYDFSFVTKSERSLLSIMLCKKFVCLFIYLVILDENFNVTIFFGLLNETNLLLN